MKFPQSIALFSALLLSIVFSPFSLAEETPNYKNLVTISPTGIGWSGTSTTTEVKSTGEEVDISSGSFKINYGRFLNPRLILKGVIASTTSETNASQSTSLNSESSSVSLDVSLIYNFSDHFTNSGFLEFGLGTSRTESEDSDGDVTEYGLTGWFATVGKRWPLEFIGLPNVSYRLGLTYASGSWEDDYEDLFDRSRGFSFQAAYFDIFF